MTPLEAARELAEDGLRVDRNTCVLCLATGEAHSHTCPVPMLPQIVAALEAAEGVVEVYRPQREWPDAMFRLDFALKGQES